MRRLLIIVCMLFIFFGSAVAQLTSGNVTIKLAGGDYSTWAAFWDDLGDLTGNITCTVDASEFTETAAPGYIQETLGGYTLHVLPATFPTKTDASDGARFVHNHADVFNMFMQGPGTVIIEGMVHKAGTGWGRACRLFGCGTAYTFIFRRNIVKGNATTAVDAISYEDDTVDAKVYNNIFYNHKENDQIIASTVEMSANSFFSNNTVVDITGGGIGCDSNTQDAILAENNLCHLCSGDDFSNVGASEGNNNSSYDATADDFGTAANNRVEKTADPFTAYGDDDFTLAVGSDPIGNGKDLSALFTDDFFGNTRSAWDIGACEYQAAAGGIEVIVDTKDGAADLEEIDGVGVADIEAIDGKP